MIFVFAMLNRRMKTNSSYCTENLTKIVKVLKTYVVGHDISGTDYDVITLLHS